MIIINEVNMSPNEWHNPNTLEHDIIYSKPRPEFSETCDCRGQRLSGPEIAVTRGCRDKKLDQRLPKLEIAETRDCRHHRLSRPEIADTTDCRD